MNVLGKPLPLCWTSLAWVMLAVSSAQCAEVSSGSGVVIGAQGDILTNAHVVEDCKTIVVKMNAQSPEAASLVVRDAKNDLAVIRIKGSPAAVVVFREGAPVRAGDTVVALGYPLSGLLASTVNLSVGNVSALAGLGDDTRYLQISAPVQPGNSGGPLLDGSGHLIGIVTAKLNAVGVARVTGDIPQNVNFALKAEVARTFLDSNGIAYQMASSSRQLSSADVGDIARPFTVHIRCSKDGSHSVAEPKKSSPRTQAKLSQCTSEYLALSAEVKKRQHILKSVMDVNLSRREVCNAWGYLSEAEDKVITYLAINQLRCNIPRDVLAQIKTSHAKTTERLHQVCAFDPD